MPRSWWPNTSPTKVADRFEDEIVRIRKELTEAGYDAGAETIGVHLRWAHRRAKVLSTATIWRVLKAQVSSPLNRTSARSPPTSASAPICPMNGGRWTSPTSCWPRAKR